MDAGLFGNEGSKYLRRHELRDGGPRRLTIASVESVENKFKPGQQVLCLVCTDGTRFELRTDENRLRVIGWFGRDTDKWVGQVIEAYYCAEVRSPRGEPGGIRLRLPEPEPDVDSFVSDLERDDEEPAPRRAKPNGSGTPAPSRPVKRSPARPPAAKGDVPF